jgi:hypothetical protein
MKIPFRHRKQIRKHENAHREHLKGLESKNVTNLRIGASGAADAGMFLDKSKKDLVNVVIPTYNRYIGSMSGKEVNQMNKSYRVAMAQALLTELAEAVARYGADNEGVKRLHRMVRAMVAELLA